MTYFWIALIAAWASDVLLLDLPVLSPILLVVMSIFFVARYAVYRKQSVGLQAKHLGVCLIAVASVQAARTANHKLAEQRMRQIVAALEVYRAENGEYPSQITEAVSPVPLAKFTLRDSEFHYACPACESDAQALPEKIWVSIGSERRSYDFALKRWESEYN